MLRPNLSLSWEDWGDQWALYQGISGETHLLNPLGSAILTNLQSDTIHLDELYERLAMEFDVAVNDDFRTQVMRSLARFEELGLIQPQITAHVTA